MRDLELYINIDTIAKNAENIKNHINGKAQITGVIKADAYGHLALTVAKALHDKGITSFAVAICEEALLLREAGIKDQILILGVTPKSGIAEAINNDIILTVSELDDIKLIADTAKALGKKAKVHLKVDSGMGRIGITTSSKMQAVLEVIKSSKLINIEGIFTHFPKGNDAFTTHLEMNKFDSLCDVVKQNGFSPFRHAAASSTMFKEECMYDGVRAGIALYGGDGSKYPVDLNFAQRLVAKPVRIERVLSGTGIGYDHTFVTQRDSLIATLPIGYADGYKRALSNKGPVIINGKRVKVVGNVCMDMLMVDVTEIPNITRDSECVLLGDGITPVELANLADTIPYEIMTSFSPRVRRKI